VDAFISGLRDLNDQPLAYGMVYHYRTGTTNELAMWLDRSKTRRADQPITLDENGRATGGTGGVGPFYADGLYSLEVRDASDTILYTLDNLEYTSTTQPGYVYLSSLSVGSLSANLVKILSGTIASSVVDRSNITNSQISNASAATLNVVSGLATFTWLHAPDSYFTRSRTDLASITELSTHNITPSTGAVVHLDTDVEQLAPHTMAVNSFAAGTAVIGSATITNATISANLVTTTNLSATNATIGSATITNATITNATITANLVTTSKLSATVATITGALGVADIYPSSGSQIRTNGFLVVPPAYAFEATDVQITRLIATGVVQLASVTTAVDLGVTNLTVASATVTRLTVATPSAMMDAANKGYVDAAIVPIQGGLFIGDYALVDLATGSAELLGAAYYVTGARNAYVIISINAHITNQCPVSGYNTVLGQSISLRRGGVQLDAVQTIQLVESGQYGRDQLSFTYRDFVTATSTPLMYQIVGIGDYGGKMQLTSASYIGFSVPD
jgi:hypothetical protein